MQFDELRLARGELQRTHAAPFVVRAKLAASWIGSGIEARSLELESPDGQLTLSARVAPPLPRLKELKAVSLARGAHEWRGTLEARGANEALELAAALESPVSMKLAGTLSGRSAHGRAAGLARACVGAALRSASAGGHRRIRDLGAGAGCGW